VGVCSFLVTFANKPTLTASSAFPMIWLQKYLKILFLPANVLFRNKYQIGHMTLCDMETVWDLFWKYRLNPHVARKCYQYVFATRTETIKALTQKRSKQTFHSCFSCDFSATCDDMHIVLYTLSAVGDVPIQISADELQYTISSNYKSHYIHIHIISISLSVFLSENILSSNGWIKNDLM